MRRLSLLLSYTCIISLGANAFAIPLARPLVSAKPIVSNSAPPPTTTKPRIHDTVVVTASRIAQPLSTVGSSITVLKGEELEEKGIVEVVDALKTIPGVSFSRNGGAGQTTTLRVRGADAGQVLVMVDGIVVNDPTNTSAFYDFSSLSVRNIDRIEVLRGPQSAVYGGNAVGGVINVITKRGEGKPTYTTNVGGGSHSSFKQEVGTYGKKGKLSYGLNLSNYNTAGYPNTVAGPEKDSAHLKNISTSMGVDVSQNVKLNFSGGASRLRSEFDSSPTTTDGPAEQVNDTAYGQVQANIKTLGSTLEHVLTANHYVVARESNEPLGFYTRSTFDGKRTTLRYQANQKLFTRDTATAGVEWQRESANNVNVSGGVPATDVNRQMVSQSAFAQYLTHPTENLALTLSGRHDASSAFESHTTARIAAAYTIDSLGTILRTSAGTSAKNPTLYQLYGPYGTATLKPEKSKGVDAGIENGFWNGRVRLQNSVFAQEYKNLIDFDNVLFVYGNVAQARSKGFENSVSVDVTPRVNLSATHTYTLAVDSATEKRLPRRPKHTGYVETNIRATNKLNVGGGVYYVTPQLDSNFATTNTSGYGSVDLHANYQMMPNLNLYIRADNVLGNDYQEVLNYNNPGRVFFAGLRASY